MAGEIEIPIFFPKEVSKRTEAAPISGTGILARDWVRLSRRWRPIMGKDAHATMNHATLGISCLFPFQILDFSLFLR